MCRRFCERPAESGDALDTSSKTPLVDEGLTSKVALPSDAALVGTADVDEAVRITDLGGPPAVAEATSHEVLTDVSRSSNLDGAPAVADATSLDAPTDRALSVDLDRAPAVAEASSREAPWDPVPSADLDGGPAAAHPTSQEAPLDPVTKTDHDEVPAAAEATSHQVESDPGSTADHNMVPAAAEATSYEASLDAVTKADDDVVPAAAEESSHEAPSDPVTSADLDEVPAVAEATSQDETSQGVEQPVSMQSGFAETEEELINLLASAAQSEARSSITDMEPEHEAETSAARDKEGEDPETAADDGTGVQSGVVHGGGADSRNTEVEASEPSPVADGPPLQRGDVESLQADETMLDVHHVNDDTLQVHGDEHGCDESVRKPRSTPSSPGSVSRSVATPRSARTGTGIPMPQSPRTDNSTPRSRSGIPSPNIASRTLGVSKGKGRGLSTSSSATALHAPKTLSASSSATALQTPSRGRGGGKGASATGAGTTGAGTIGGGSTGAGIAGRARGRGTG